MSNSFARNQSPVRVNGPIVKSANLAKTVEDAMSEGAFPGLEMDDVVPLPPDPPVIFWKFNEPLTKLSETAKLTPELNAALSVPPLPPTQLMKLRELAGFVLLRLTAKVVRILTPK